MNTGGVKQNMQNYAIKMFVFETKLRNEFVSNEKFPHSLSVRKVNMQMTRVPNLAHD